VGAELRQDAPDADAHRDSGEPGAPPGELRSLAREVGALTRQLGAPGRTERVAFLARARAALITQIFWPHRQQYSAPRVRAPQTGHQAHR